MNPRYVAYLVSVLVLTVACCLIIQSRLDTTLETGAIAVLTFVVMLVCLPIVLWKKGK